MFSQLLASKSRDRWDMYICSAVHLSEQIQINSSVSRVSMKKATGVNRGRNWDAGWVEEKIET